MTGDQGTSDEQWDEFVREFHRSSATPRQSAAEQAASPRPEPKRGRRGLATVSVLCLLAAVAGAGYWFGPWRQAGARPVTAARGGSVAPAAVRPTVQAFGAVTPEQAFPVVVDGYARVATVADASCVRRDTVGPTLAGMFTQDHGCRGAALALYKDVSGDEYNIAVFTMNDPHDVIDLVTVLGTHPTDFEVVAQLPPKGSGLRELGADSGIVQSYAGYGHLLMVGMAQWSDGHASDYQRLEDKLSPLLDAIAKEAAPHDPRPEPRTPGPVTADDLAEGVRRGVALLRQASRDAADWAVPAGSLRWDCWETVEHLADDLFAYAAQLGPQSPPASDFVPFVLSRPGEGRPRSTIFAQREAGVDGLLLVLEACGAMLVAMVRTAAPEARAFHGFGTADAEGSAAMGLVETLVHLHDVAEGLGLEWTPPAGLCARSLHRLFPDAPTDTDPWATLLWATGRGELPGRERVGRWRWYSAPR